jgi:hypothetical protein
MISAVPAIESPAVAKYPATLAITSFIRKTSLIFE